MIRNHMIRLAAAVALSAVLSFADDIYRNDFSTRTSATVLPGDRWMSYTYDPDHTLYRNYPSNEEVPNACWSKKDEFQDGWAKAYMDSNSMGSPPAFAVATDSDHGSPTNYFALFRSSTSRNGTAIQSFHNEFTNGTLRLEVDIRRPAVWGTINSEAHAARVLLVYRKYMDPNWHTGVAKIEHPVMFGAQWDGGDKLNRLKLFYAESYGGTEKNLEPGANGDNYVCNENWYRWRVYVDLDRKNSKYYIWDVGPDQPDGPNTRADSTATRKVEKDTYFFRMPMTEETGGIAGIGLNGYRFKAGTGETLAVTNAPCFDNIRIAWKAPGSSEYVPFYENDFNTRRYRRIQPTPSTATDYPVDVDVSSVDIFSSYAAMVSNTVDDANQTLLVGNNVADTPGMDNWKRLENGAKFTVVDSKTTGGYMLRASAGGKGVVAQTLGETITSGKVRISGDVRLPSAWNGVENARVCLALGDPTYWSGNPSSYTSHHIGYGGITGLAVDEFRPAYLPKSGTLTTTISPDVTCIGTNWYRMVVTADLGTKTYDYELYALGEDAGPIDRSDVPSEPIYATNGIAFRNNISGIGAFSLFAQRSSGNVTGLSGNWDGYILWDNIQVWKNWDSSAGTGTLIYSNDFNGRRWYVEREKTELTHGVYTGTGVDAWEQVFQGDGTGWIMGGANRFLSIKAPGTWAFYSAQPLPFELPCGQRVTFRVDVRPPCWWLNVGGQLLNIFLGGDTMCQYADPDASPAPLDDSVLAFSIYPAAPSLGRYTNTIIRAQNGGGMRNLTGRIETDHWYRLEGTTVSGSDNWKFRAYDMGTTHPEIDAPPGELVVQADGLARRSSVGATSGISSILISAGGVPGLEPWDLYDRGRVLVDNIVVTTVPSGTCIIVR